MKTAVEWLAYRIDDIITESLRERVDLLKNEAKVMEKEQIINAYDKGEFNQGCNDEAEQYYNETYKK
jgi:hypothetical protein